MTDTAVGAKFYIGPVSTAATAEAFEALSFAEVAGVEDIAEFGDTFSDSTFTPLATGRTQHRKGAVDGGAFDIVVDLMETGAGLDALIVASKSRSGNYAMKVELDDEPSGGTPTTFYWLGRVMSNRRNIGNADNVMRRTFSIAVNSDVIEVEAAA
ncbi:hypothetical protein [Methylobrevis pamukkalensis]|uniref:Phage major tail protein 2 n=1 Tax=Methylobrevis pamukkalensis TaxID=1439726 RepID=A0A1E3GXP7_9HYPH|nr:hypothetical protein [Methylobrevis pamukkalensis]ODN68849.1 hypothetical protein A6302_03854 [Methylobrevis pamukkalensis]